MTSCPFGHLIFIKNMSLNPVHTQRKGTTPKCGGGTSWGRVRAPLLMWLAWCHPLPIPSVSPGAHSRLWHTRHDRDIYVGSASLGQPHPCSKQLHSALILLSLGVKRTFTWLFLRQITLWLQRFFFVVEVKNKSISRLKSWSKVPGTTCKIDVGLKRNYNMRKAF